MVWKQRGIIRRDNRLVASENSIIEFSNDDTNYLQVVIYQNGFPVLIGYGMKGNAKLKLSRAGFSLKGAATIDIRAYTNTGSEQKLKGNLEII
jgi:hypothetical protein